MGEKLRIAFMGTPDFAAHALRALCDSDHDIVCVLATSPSKGARS